MGHRRNRLLEMEMLDFSVYTTYLFLLYTTMAVYVNILYVVDGRSLELGPATCRPRTFASHF